MRRYRLLAVVIAALFAWSCSDDTTPSSDGAPDDAALDGPQGDGPQGDGPQGDGPQGDGPQGDGPATDAPGDAPAGDGAKQDGPSLADAFVVADGWNPSNQPACSGTVYACSDGIDNDNDGVKDAQDPDCIGPCDNDEASLETGIPGDNMDACKQDCFFDGNSGGGDDDCAWDHRCDPKSPGGNLAKPCPYDSTYTKCDPAQSQTCLDFCLPITPNGCDCFGCCEIYSSGVKHIVYLGSGPTCSVATPQNCAECTQVPDCLNDCADCELCMGKTMSDLPPHCFTHPPDAGVPDGFIPGDGPKPDGYIPPDFGPPIYLPLCPPGIDPCLDNSWCKTGYYCITGCCKSSIG